MLDSSTRKRSSMNDCRRRSLVLILSLADLDLLADLLRILVGDETIDDLDEVRLEDGGADVLGEGNLGARLVESGLDGGLGGIGADLTLKRR